MRNWLILKSLTLDRGLQCLGKCEFTVRDTVEISSKTPEETHERLLWRKYKEARNFR